MSEATARGVGVVVVALAKKGWSFRRRELSRSTSQTEDMPPTLHLFILFLLLCILLLLP
jgi:hypothetical protein